MLTADSAKINGPFRIAGTSGDMFTFIPNWNFPTPMHDLMRVSTDIFTVMGGSRISAPLTAGVGIFNVYFTLFSRNNYYFYL